MRRGVPLAALLVALAGCSGGGGGTRFGPPGGIYSFVIPSGFSKETYDPAFFSGPLPGPDTTQVNTDGDKDAILLDVDHGHPRIASLGELVAAKRAAETASARREGYTLRAVRGLRVAGRPAVAFDLVGLRIHQQSSGGDFGPYHQHHLWIAAGTDRLSVTCQWEDDPGHTRAVRRGCARVQATLRIRGR